MRHSIPEASEDRLRLIGDLLCKGILGSPALRAAPEGAASMRAVVPSTPEERILAYLRQHEWASPSEMRAVLSLSRTRTSQVLRRLVLANQIASNGGKTTAAAYRLNNFDVSRN